MLWKRQRVLVKEGGWWGRNYCCHAAELRKTHYIAKCPSPNERISNFRFMFSFTFSHTFRIVDNNNIQWKCLPKEYPQWVAWWLMSQRWNENSRKVNVYIKVFVLAKMNDECWGGGALLFHYLLVSVTKNIYFILSPLAFLVDVRIFDTWRLLLVIEQWLKKAKKWKFRWVYKLIFISNEESRRYGPIWHVLIFISEWGVL